MGGKHTIPQRKMAQRASSSSTPVNGGAGHNGTQTAEPSAGSQTQTEAPAAQAAPILRLRGEHTARPGPRVQWDESVVDNEGMGKKSSKGEFGFYGSFLFSLMSERQLLSEKLGHANDDDHCVYY